MTTNETNRLTALVADLQRQKAERERKYPMGATLANPSYCALIERISYLKAVLKTEGAGA